MSYSATICFKTVKHKELYKFFSSLKAFCKANFDQTAKDNFIFMPTINRDYMLAQDSQYAKEQLDRAWMRNSVFNFRFFYLPQHNLLGMFNIPTIARRLFDTTCFFQNSTDQNYDYDDWKGVPLFEKIAEKWKNATDEQVIAAHPYPEELMESKRFDYYRKTFAYDEIWKICSDFLFSEDSVVYLSLFGGYEIAEQLKFVSLCNKYYQEWKDKNEKEREGQD